MNSLLSPQCDTASSTELTIASVGRPAVALAMSLLLIGCTGLRIEYFTDESYQPRRAVDQIEWLEQEPAQPHIDLARITVSSANLSEESLRGHLRDRARSLGADAIIREAPMTLISKAGSPYYEPGLFSPAGAAFSLYGYGWYQPYASNPYLLTQGATDQPRFDHYLSAVAIRYLQESESAPSR
jgi:hypothetical protein